MLTTRAVPKLNEKKKKQSHNKSWLAFLKRLIKPGGVPRHVSTLKYGSLGPNLFAVGCDNSDKNPCLVAFNTWKPFEAGHLTELGNSGRQ